MVGITWTGRAKENLEEIGKYISRDSTRYAVNVLKEIYRATERLIIFPESGRNLPELSATNLREIIVGNFRIIYTRIDNNIIIVTVLHSRRNVKKLLKKK